MGRASKAQTVKLREKPLKNGGASLYLEWNSGGKTEKKYLNIHLTKGRSTQDKEVDRKNLAVAQALRNQGRGLVRCKYFARSSGHPFDTDICEDCG